LGLHPQKIVKSTGVFEEIFEVYCAWHHNHSTKACYLCESKAFFILGI
jgi:hypothetical protein